MRDRLRSVFSKSPLSRGQFYARQPRIRILQSRFLFGFRLFSRRTSARPNRRPRSLELTMQKKPAFESGALIPRILVAFVLVSVATWLAMLSFATPAPPADTLSTSHPSVTYTDSTGAPPNLTGVALGKPNCGPTNSLCSIFTLTIDPSIGTPVTGYDPT